jgi:hypothetical protein
MQVYISLYINLYRFTYQNIDLHKFTGCKLAQVCIDFAVLHQQCKGDVSLKIPDE